MIDLVDELRNSKTYLLCELQVRYLPDNATIIKVTGRFLETGVDDQISDILMFPDVESPPRSPIFLESSRFVVIGLTLSGFVCLRTLMFHIQVNSNAKAKLTLSTDSILLLRVYTIVKLSREIVIVGNCLLKIFDDVS